MTKASKLTCVFIMILTLSECSTSTSPKKDLVKKMDSNLYHKNNSTLIENETELDSILSRLQSRDSIISKLTGFDSSQFSKTKEVIHIENIEVFLKNENEYFKKKYIELEKKINSADSIINSLKP